MKASSGSSKSESEDKPTKLSKKEKEEAEQGFIMTEVPKDKVDEFRAHPAAKPWLDPSKYPQHTDFFIGRYVNFL